MQKIGLIVPTLNPGCFFSSWLQAFQSQRFKPDKLLIIDSSSDDKKIISAIDAGFQIQVIPRVAFNHGGTRQIGFEMMRDVDVIVFLTQDAVLADVCSLERLVSCFKDPEVGAAYGRQLPSVQATPIAAHARLFNYPDLSENKSFLDKTRLGIKTVFISNSFAAYRTSALISVGGFPLNVILSEDTYVCAKMVLSGFKIAYCAEAKVFHSHNYGLIEEFRRYFDLGVFHSRESWIMRVFGKAEGEGFRFIHSELSYLLKQNVLQVPIALIRSVLKYVGYKMGMIEKRIPNYLKVYLSMNKSYWKLN